MNFSCILNINFFINRVESNSSTPSNGQNKYYISVPSSDNNLIDILDSRIVFFVFLSPFDSTQILGISNDRMNAFGAWDSVRNVFVFLLFRCLIFWQSRVGFPACISPDGANSGRGSAAKHAVKK